MNQTNEATTASQLDAAVQAIAPDTAPAVTTAPDAATAADAPATAATTTTAPAEAKARRAPLPADPDDMLDDGDDEDDGVPVSAEDGPLSASARTAVGDEEDGADDDEGVGDPDDGAGEPDAEEAADAAALAKLEPVGPPSRRIKSPAEMHAHLNRQMQFRSAQSLAGKRLITIRPLPVNRHRTIPANVDVTEEAQGWQNRLALVTQGYLVAVDGTGIVAQPKQAEVARQALAAPFAPTAPAAPPAASVPAAPTGGGQTAPAAPGGAPAKPAVQAVALDARARADLQALSRADSATRVREVMLGAGVPLDEGISKAKMLQIRDQVLAAQPKD